ncbi:MAG TPA: TAT-variant-translocated molybdopterin oxidoreductase, partial [Ignavibacteriaceae bacterium]
MADIIENQNQNSSENNPDVNYWRSLEELYKDSKSLEASHHEFHEGVTDDFNPLKLPSLSRRKFLALVGASAALAGAGCSDYPDKGEIIPYVKKPEEITLGKADYYASTCNACENACGILIKTREGRPVKVDGNPDHPVSKGKLCSRGHAGILNLYDPERLQSPRKRNGRSLTEISWENADGEIKDALSKAGNKEIAIITKRINSPTSKKVLDDFKAKYPSAQVYSYELFNESIRNAAWVKSYGSGQFPVIKWNEAKIILALESDFLGTEGNVVENSRLYAEGRDVSDLKNFNRLYVAEGNMSLTGSNADYRMRLKPEAMYEFVSMLIGELGGGSAGKSDSFAQKYNLSVQTLKFLIADLDKYRGASIIYAGDKLPEQIHIAVNYLNNLLGNDALYREDQSRYSILPLSAKADWESLITRMNNGDTAVVIHYDCNPVYHLADDFGYRVALKKVSTVVSLTESENESSEYANYILPINHTFESWGDAKTRSGFSSLQQPVIRPIFNTRQKEAVLLHWLKDSSQNYDPGDYHSYLMAHWKDNVFPSLNSKLNFEQYWSGVLQDGIAVTNDKAEPIQNFNPSAYESGGFQPGEQNGYTVVLRESYATGDGTFANNGWMQELPHPVSKITWDNYAAISNTTAKEMGVKSDDLVDIQIGSRKLQIPVFIQPGSADKTVTIELGYGRSKSGIVGLGVGFNANVLLSKDGSMSPWIYTGASVAKTGDTYRLVTAQEHHAFDEDLTRDALEKRKIVKEGTVSQYKKNPNFLREETGEKNESLYPDYE